MKKILPIIVIFYFSVVCSSMAQNKGLEFRLACPQKDNSCEIVTNNKTGYSVFVHKEILLGSDDVEKIEKEQNSIQIKFTETGKVKLEKITAGNLNKQLALLINGNLIMAPNIAEPIKDGVVWVTGKYTESEIGEIFENFREAIPTKTQTKNGVVREKYAGGGYWEEVSYKDGKREGVSKTFSPDGTLSSDSSYVNDKLEGPAKVYYKNGNVMSTGNFKNGKEDGSLKYFYEDGTLWDEKNFKDGKLLDKQGNLYNGVYREYNQNGKIHREMNYKDGENEGDYKLYYKNGQLQFYGLMAQGKLQKWLEEYDENGKQIKR